MTAVQITDAQLKGMSAAQITAAYNAGQLDQLLGRTEDQPAFDHRVIVDNSQIGADQLKGMSAEDIVAANRAGKFTDLFNTDQRMREQVRGQEQAITDAQASQLG